MNKAIFIIGVILMSMTGLQECISKEILKEELFANPLLISAKISPDGKTIAYVGADAMGISNVFTRPTEGPMVDCCQITFYQTPEIIQFFWSGDSHRILLLKDENGIGQLHLHGIHISSKQHLIY